MTTLSTRMRGVDVEQLRGAYAKTGHRSERFDRAAVALAAVYLNGENPAPCKQSVCVLVIRARFRPARYKTDECLLFNGSLEEKSFCAVFFFLSSVSTAQHFLRHLAPACKEVHDRADLYCHTESAQYSNFVGQTCSYVLNCIR